MNDELILRIKKELATDPDGKGYAGKTPEELVALLNSPTVKVTDILQPEPPLPPPAPGTKIGEKTVVLDAPVLKLLVGIPATENLISLEQVEKALQ